MMDKMNWKLNNKFNNTEQKIEVSVDKDLAEAFVSKPRTPQQCRNFEGWADMSREREVIKTILQRVQVLELEQTKQR